jgi:uncharacterized phiE125 gp8 family phage protein
LAEVKEALRIEDETEDALLLRLVVVARQRCEQATGLSMIAQRWRLTLDRWPGERVMLPFRPVASVEAVRVMGADVAPQNYRIETEDGGLLATSAWPAPGQRYGGIEIDFTSGFGASWNDVPEGLRQGMLMLVAALYEAREGEGEGVPAGVLALWSPYRRVRL